MAILPILTAPDPRLEAMSQPVEKVDGAIRRLMDDLLETMHAAPGIGLAAPQVGVQKRVLVLDIAKDGSPPAPLQLANPEIIWTADEMLLYEEGCLSLPDQYGEVARPARSKIRYLDPENEIREIEAEGLLATCIQHEIDHLTGVLFVAHLSTLKRNIILRKLAKVKRLQAIA